MARGRIAGPAGGLVVALVCAASAGAVSEGASLVKDINPSGASNPDEIVVLGTSAFFTADDGVHGRELWKTDGTPAGTVMVRDIANAAGAGSNPTELTNVNGTLFFAADDGTNGIELWKSDGTAAGTALVEQINPGAADSGPRGLGAINGKLWFAADDGTSGLEFWISDGTGPGTELERDFDPDPGEGIEGFEGVTQVGTLGFFVTYDGQLDDYTLWGGDENAVTAVLPPMVNPPADLTAYNGELYFSAYVFATGSELYRTEDDLSTGIVTELRPGPDSSFPNDLTVFAGELYFAAESAGFDQELWKTNGTAPGTTIVKNVNPTGGSVPDSLTAVGSTLFFAADDGAHGIELWSSDGTAVGTAMVRDLVPGGASSHSLPGELTNSGGTLFFAADGPQGRELFQSDGTLAGTEQVANINPEAVGVNSNPAELTDFSGELLFSADDGAGGRELWRNPALAPVVDPDPKPNPDPNPTPDTSVDGRVLKAKSIRKQKSDAVTVKFQAGAAEAVTVRGQAKVKLDGNARAAAGQRLKLIGKPTAVAAGKLRKITLKAKPDDSKSLLAALGRGREAIAKLKVRYTDAAGNTAVLRKRITLTGE